MLDPKLLAEVADAVRSAAKVAPDLAIVAEAREHVLTFDWADVARQAAVLYEEVTAAWAGSAAPRA